MIPTSEGKKKHVFMIAILLLSALLSGCGEKAPPGTAKTATQTISGVTVTVVQPTKIIDYYETSGTVKAETSSIIASRVPGTVTAVYVRAGDSVKAGQLLAVIDDREAVQKLRAAEQNLKAALYNRDMADLSYRRYKMLHDEQALARHEIDQIETRKKIADAGYGQALAGLEEARVLHGFTRITSPAAGVVTDKRIDPGSMAIPGIPLFTVERKGKFLLEAAADESLSGKLSVGTPVAVSVDSIGLTVTGKIREVIPAVDPATRTFLVKISLSAEGLRSGLFARVRLPGKERAALLVPREAIVKKGQLTGVYSVNADEIVTYRLVRTGKVHDGGVEILSGLDAGERILTAGLERAVDGGRLAGGAAR